MHTTIQKVRLAYEILAYPQCTKLNRWDIEDDLEHDRAWHDRNSVELNDTETSLVGTLAQIAEIPFDPKKRKYEYVEVLTRRDLTPKP
jgi:hypothetical protein